MPSDDRDDGVPPHRYDAAMATEIETRWQDRWEREHTFESPNPAGSLADPAAVGERGDKLFVLDMFPYPSGVGLHVGHPLGYIATDTYVRFQRMKGRNVLYSMGFDAFGLPAEQYAVQTGQHPAITTQQNIDNMRRQLRRLGLSHDLRRSVSTTDPEYYRWTQWIFLQIFNSWYDTESGRARPITELITEFESGARTPGDGGEPWADRSASEKKELIDDHRLAYLSDSPVNWCPGLGTVVANEEVTADGRSDRGNFPVFTKNMRQWTLRITAYADRLIDDLDLLDWSDAIKTMQRNWIGRSPGARVVFDSPAGSIEVFTTRPDTLFGASFMVLAPEHALVDTLTTDDRRAEVTEYRAQAAARSTEDRLDDDKAKTGVFTGGYATNPINGRQIPVWIGDYVLGDVGTGAIMAVPCGDQRDFEFATKYGLGIPAIQSPPDQWFDDHGVSPTTDATKWPAAYVGDAPYVDSANDTLDLNGVATKDEAIALTVGWLETKGHGRGEVRYKLRDWLFSRQRYWGEPFPIVYDADGRPHALPDELLPLELPPTDSFMPRSFDPDDRDSEPESPLSRLDEWMEVELDLGDGPATYRRDHNVMPQWAGSCWYELRYLDPDNRERFVDPEVERYWMGPRATSGTTEGREHPGGVDLYVGGVEHAVLHLLYARFWHKVLFDLGHLSSKEPYYRLFNQGYILADAYTDSRGIYVEASEVVDRDGAFYHDDEPVTREWGKMGKSLKNAVSPDEMYDRYGADTLRLYEMSMGPVDASRPWDARDVVGMYRFLQRVWRNLIDEETGELRVVDGDGGDETTRLRHHTIDAVGNDLAEMRFNTAVAKLIEFNNHLTKLGSVDRRSAEALVLLLSPLAPHLSEELWTRLGHETSLTYEPFPEVDAAALVAESVELPVQVNGKVRGRIEVAVGSSEDDIRATALADERVRASIGDAEIRKTIVIPDRMVSIVV